MGRLSLEDKKKEWGTPVLEQHGQHKTAWKMNAAFQATWIIGKHKKKSQIFSDG